MKKRCYRCGLEKLVRQFSKGNSACKACHRKLSRDHYTRKTGPYTERRIARRKRLQETVRNLKNNPCSDCSGTFHFSAMDFDHVGTDKRMAVSRCVTANVSEEYLLTEIAKCELVCANCHRVRTYKRRMG